MPTSFDAARTCLSKWVKQFLDLNTPNSKGVSKRTSLEFSRKQEAKLGVSAKVLAKKYAELEEVEVPREVGHLRYHFIQLGNTRQEGVNGYNPITFTEIANYLALTETELTPWEIETIRFMDVAFLSEINKRNMKEDK